jgi:hypothetical protein
MTALHREELVQPRLREQLAKALERDRLDLVVGFDEPAGERKDEVDRCQQLTEALHTTHRPIEDAERVQDASGRPPSPAQNARHRGG